MNYSDKVIDLLKTSYSQFHSCKNICELLKENGFISLDEKSNFKLEKGKNYFVTRNLSSVIAFKIPSEIKDLSFLITASHSDSPTFKLKPNPVIKVNNLTLLNVEPYGGMINSTWLDRPLSIGGRIIVKSKDGLDQRIVNIDKNLLTINNLCIHMNRDINNGYKFNNSKDMLPIISSDENFDFNLFIKKELNLKDDEEILSFDLYLYVRELPTRCGANSEFVLSSKLDDLSSSYSSLLGFIDSKSYSKILVYSCFDNEEVGSLTRQGANSTFLKDTLQRIVSNFKLNNDDYQKGIANSVLISIDNAHANHPNHLEVSDKTTSVLLNKGIVIKYNANQSYTSDSLSSSIVKYICKHNNLNYQEYTNRSDLRGGSTLGNISNSEVSLISADIGIAQLAMHSSMEMCGYYDIEDMANFVKGFYQSNLSFENNKVNFN